jgi:alpha-1,2-mannosyltransferase
MVGGTVAQRSLMPSATRLPMFGILQQTAQPAPTNSRSEQISICPGLGLSAFRARRLAFAIAIPMWVLGIGLFHIGIPTDFVAFYTMGALVAADEPAALYDPAAFIEAQHRFRPRSDLPGQLGPLLYPPQMPVLLAPLGMLPYQVAGLLWALLSAAVYGAVVWLAWNAVRDDVPDGRLVAAAALAFAPAWHLVVNQQMTAILLVACTAGWLALERGLTLLAGLAFGVLAVKPQFGLVLVPLVIARREWRVMLGAAISVSAQLAAVIAVLGIDSVFDYVAFVPWMAAHADVLEGLPLKSHSIRALTRFLPFGLGTPVWVVSSIALIAIAIRTWRPEVPLHLRLGLVLLASVLVNPHVIVYDAVLLVLPMLWLGAAAARAGGRDRDQLYRAVVVLFASFLAFFTASESIGLVGMVASVVTMFYVFIVSARFAPARAQPVSP